MKLTKENIYINLQGKSKEELTELWEFLNSAGEIVSGTKEYFIETHLKYNNSFIALVSDNTWKWWGSYNKTEVTIDQLKQIIKPMGTFRPTAMKCTLDQFETIKPKLKEMGKIGDLLFAFKDDNLYLVNNYNGEKVYFDISYCGDYNRKVYEQWNEEVFLKACGIETEPTLAEQLQKAEAEVKRLKEAIYDSKIKIGDWVVSSLNDCIFRYQYGRLEDDLTKIQDKELINKLNELIK